MFAFVTLVIGNLGLIFANRSPEPIYRSLRFPNKALWWITAGALLFLTLVLLVPPLRDAFQFAPLHNREIALLCLTGGVSLVLSEVTKLRWIQRLIHGRGE